jgi:hypothetical protein
VADTGQKFPTTNVEAKAGIEAAWANKNNAHLNDGVDSTGSATLAAALGPTDWSGFHLLAEDGGTIMSGATILTTTVRWEIGSSGGGTPTFFYGENISGVITESSRAGDATYPLVVTRTPTITRANLDDSILKVRARATQGGVTQTSAWRLDYISVQVTWTFYVDKSGGASSQTGAGGNRTAFVTRLARGGASTAAGGAARTALASKVGGSVAISGAGGVRTSFVTRLAAGALSVARAGGVRTELVARSGGASSTSAAGGAKTALISGKVVGGIAVGRAGSVRTALLARAGGAASALAGRSLARTALVARVGGAVAISSAGGVRKALVARAGSGFSALSGGGDARTYQPSISGYTRTGSGSLIAGARVDIFRTDTKAFLGSVTSDGSGFYVYGTSRLIPAFFIRAYKAGPPNLFATSDEDLLPFEAQVAGPPL